MNEKLVVENISKDFGSNEVLHNLCFAVYEGEFLSVLGPSGCGKTTLLRMLIGLEQPTGGKIYKDGIDITNSMPSARGMGIVFQNYALFENMTVLGNVEYALRKNPAFKEQARETAERLIEQVGLAEYKNKRPGKLSGGQQQRVAIARTLALNPDIILFDEPMSALDVDTRLALRQELKNIQKKFGSTMIYITHDQEEAFAMSDRIMVLSEGKIQQIDTPRNIIDHPANEYIQRFVIHNIQLKIDSLIQFARAKV